MKKYLIVMIFALSTVSFSAGSMTVEEVIQDLEKNFYPIQIKTIRLILDKAKLSENAFKVENEAAITEFLQLKNTGATIEDLLTFATAKEANAKAQMEKFTSMINNYAWKSTAGYILSWHVPHMGLNGSPQMYEDWIVEIEKLSK